jgi:hypothetical protein
LDTRTRKSGQQKDLKEKKMKFLIIIILFLLMATVSVAADKIYILGDRNVEIVLDDVMTGEDPIVINCQDDNNQDPIGCIITANRIR